MSEQSLTVSAIKDGSVIDHIPSDMTLKVAEILKLNDAKEIVSVAFNLESKLMGKKGIVKGGSKFLRKKEIDKIDLISPLCKINIIENYKVKEKIKLEIPKEIIGIVKCINPNCITNIEDVKTKFIVEETKPLKIRCSFCEKVLERSEIMIK
jgi:aspartate carbamoyltransferase regulatory subunit